LAGCGSSVYISTSKQPKNQRRLVHRVVYNDEDGRKFRKRNTSSNDEPSNSSANSSSNDEQFVKTARDTSSGFATFPNENNENRVLIDRKEIPQKREKIPLKR
jgi:hypothetical protein